MPFKILEGIFYFSNFNSQSKQHSLMNNRLFGKNNYKVSEVGLGCWQIGADWGNVDDSSAKEIIKTTLDNGINFFDTADVYGDGRSETLLGNYFKGKTDDIYIATKIGRTSNLYPDNYTKKGITTAIENSLKRLKLNSLDLVQLHCIPTAEMKKGDVFEWLSELKRDGKIKEFGASVETTAEAEMLIKKVPELYSLQVIFNIFRQKPIYEVFQLAKKYSTGIIARVPLASGLLTGKFSHKTSFTENDHRTYNRDGKYFNVGETFAGLPFHYGVEMANEIKKFVPEGMSMTEFSLRWVLDHETVSVVIPGASKPEHVIGNTKSSALPQLSLETHKYLVKFYFELIHKYIRGTY